MLALQGVPGVYVHSLFGSPSDHAAYARFGWKRDLNHGRFELEPLEALMADPSSRPARVFERYCRLLAARRAEPAFRPNAPQQVLELGPAIFGLRRGPREGRSVLALHNLSRQPRRIDALPLGGAAVDLIGGRQIRAAAGVELAPYEAVWLAAESSRR